MATLTSAKYAGVLTSVGTTTMTDSGATFSSGDFDAQRIIGLWTAGGVYKGMSWVRRRLSNTQIELEQLFFDKNGAVVTQAIGDGYKVSNRWADVVTTGIAVSGNAVTLTDSVIFGTNNVSDSVCFYDEDVQINSNAGANAALEFRGGLAVFGHLINFSQRTFLKGCNLLIRGVGASGGGGNGDQFKITNSAAKVWWLGGSILAEIFPSRLVGHNASTPVSTPAEWQKYWGVNVNCDLCSPSNGSNWASGASDQEVADIVSSVSGQYAINLRWGDGIVKGGTFKLSGGIALSIFGSDAGGTYNIGAEAGQSIIILDNGFGSTPALWRTSTTDTQTINYTNLIAINRKHGGGLVNNALTPGIDPANNVTAFFRFSGLYANLLNGTLSLIKNNNLQSTVQDFLTVSGTGKAVLTAQEATVVGHTETVTENSWVSGFYLYGYNFIAGSFATEIVDLGTAGTARNVKFGGFVGQVVDVNISQATAATVAAYTVLTTLDRVYDYAQYFKALNTTNAIYPAYNQQLISSAGGVLSTPVAQNITIDNAAVSVFDVNTGTITLKPTTAIASGTKADTLKLSANKILTFAQNGDKSGCIFDATAGGCIIVVAPEATNLQKSLLTGATISVSGSTETAIVIVDSIAGITAGARVTLQTPPVNFTAAALTSATFNRVRCRLSLVPNGPVSINELTGARLTGGIGFTTANVNTGANTITLTGINGKINTNTIIRFFGTDVPEPLDARAVYYPSSSYTSGNNLSVSGTPGGSSIDLTDVGSGSDMFASLWTELNQQLITSGSYTVDLGTAATTASVTLANGDLLVLQAVHWAGNPQAVIPCIASELLEETYQYSGTAISTLSSLTPATLHNQFCVLRGKDGSQVTEFLLDPSNPGKIQLDTSASSFRSDEAALFYYYVRSTSIGLRLLRDNMQLRSVNEIKVVGMLTIDAANRASCEGPYIYRSDGQFLTAIESAQIEYRFANPIGVVSEVKVPVNLSEQVLALLHGTAAGVGYLVGSDAGGGGGLDAAGVRAAVGLENPNLGIQLNAIKTKTDNLPASPASTADVQVTVSGGFLTADRNRLFALPTTPTDLTAVTNALIAIQGVGFNSTTNSLKALRDRGDVGWITATGFSVLTAQNVADALKLAPTAGSSAINSVYSVLGSINSKTANLPAFPASAADVQVGSGGFTSADRVALEAIPTLAEIENSGILAKEATAMAAANNAAAGL